MNRKQEKLCLKESSYNLYEIIDRVSSIKKITSDILKEGDYEFFNHEYRHIKIQSNFITIDELLKTTKELLEGISI